jgi:hypothetical protein
MKNIVATGQVSGKVEAHEAQVTPPVTPPVDGQPESRPEWFSKGGRTFLSANKKLMAGWKTRPPLWETDKALKKIPEKIGI